MWNTVSLREVGVHQAVHEVRVHQAGGVRVHQAGGVRVPQAVHEVRVPQAGGVGIPQAGGCHHHQRCPRQWWRDGREVSPL